MYEDSPKKTTYHGHGNFSSINTANACNSDSAVLVSSPWWVLRSAEVGVGQVPTGGSSDSGVAPSNVPGNGSVNGGSEWEKSRNN